ncbi:hypothetical protein Golob_006927 [Gossypium lobatum]|uniref:Uncharacterized protein n=1 Tax=Gossypium lobatum TaxID=34289 RepID=A0A7J8NG04_9ROSI|nr:hypothetical protein [Gossypium lobatum]
MREQFRDFVEFFNSNVKKIYRVLNSTMGKLTEKNDAVKAMMMASKEEIMATTRALNTRIEELKRELAMCQATVSRGVLGATLNREIDVSKSKEFTGTRFASDVDNFLWGMDSMDERRDETAAKTLVEFQKEFKAQFYSEYVEDDAWAKLCRFMQRVIENFESSKPNGKGNGGEDEGHDENSLKISVFLAIKGDVEPKEEAMRLGFIDCLERFKLSATSKGEKVEPDEKSALVDKEASNLFISERITSKLGLSIRKSNKRIKMANFKEIFTMGVARGVELQLGEWKAENVLYGRNINSVDRTAEEAHMEMLAGLKPVESLVGLPPMIKVGCASDFGGKVVMQIGQTQESFQSSEVGKPRDL